MLRRAMLAGTTLPLLAPGLVRAQADDALRAAGWVHELWPSTRPAQFRATAEGLAIDAGAAGSLVWRPLESEAGCLSWRWRVEAGPPATNLARRGGDDRAVSLGLGFDGFPADSTLWQRTQHAAAQLRAGGRTLPRSVLFYVWGGTGQEARFFRSPYLAGLASVRVLRPAGAPTGRWFEERVDLGADWRESFGGAAPPLRELAVSSDTDDTGSRAVAAVERLRLAACR